MVCRKLDKLKYMIAKKKKNIYIYITVNRLLLLNRSLIVEHCSGSNSELPGFVGSILAAGHRTLHKPSVSNLTQALCEDSYTRLVQGLLHKPCVRTLTQALCRVQGLLLKPSVSTLTQVFCKDSLYKPCVRYLHKPCIKSLTQAFCKPSYAFCKYLTQAFCKHSYTFCKYLTQAFCKYLTQALCRVSYTRLV